MNNRLQLVAVFGLCLGVWATWPLWGATHSFPQIPWISALVSVPPAVDGVLVGLSVIAALVLVVTERVSAPRLMRWSRFALSLAAAGLLALDQHRLQPWVLHLLVVLWLLWLAPGAWGLSLVRAFVSSIYVHSALSRFDRASLEMQWELLSPLLERIGVSTRFTTTSERLSAGTAFAVWELVTAVLLVIPRTRRLGLWTSIVMHAGLLLILGPLGQDHHAGVLVWNAVWIVQNLVLFSRPIQPAETHGQSDCSAPHPGPLPRWSPGARSMRSSGERGASILASVLICAPLLEPWEWWDHWPSWRVYSARPETVTVYVNESRVAELPEELRRFIGPPAPLSEWRPLSFDAWSFAELRCPVYPQERFRSAAALAVALRFDLGDDVRVVIGSSPDRWTGRREQREIIGERAITAECDRFVVNTAARQW